jgi:glycosyltransferase involved in cell wall biosynthesis
MDALVAPSHRVREIYADLGVEAARLRVLHLSLRHLQELRPQRLDVVTGPIRFVSLNGLGSRQKGADVIVDAVNALHREGLAERFTLDLYGYTSSSARRRLPDAPGVYARGSYAPSELDRLLDGYHVGIVPSIWEEPYGLVGPELLSKGIPVIGNARGGIVDYVRDGATGWINRSADADGLAAIMRALIRDPQQIVERNHWILEHRSALIKPLGRHLTELDAVYHEVMASGRPEGLGPRASIGP